MSCGYLFLQAGIDIRHIRSQVELRLYFSEHLFTFVLSSRAASLEVYL
jgi:hypothetical protein